MEIHELFGEEEQADGSSVFYTGELKVENVVGEIEIVPTECHIVLPKEIKSEYASKFKSAFLDAIKNQYIRNIFIHCDGYGGEWMGVIDIGSTIQQGAEISDKHIQSNFNSQAMSGHSVIWAMTPYRSCGRYAVLGIHDASFVGDMSLNSKSTKEVIKEAELNTDILSRIYRDASNKSAEFWNEQLLNNGEKFINLTKDEMGGHGMINTVYNLIYQ